MCSGNQTRIRIGDATYPSSRPSNAPACSPGKDQHRLVQGRRIGFSVVKIDRAEVAQVPDERPVGDLPHVNRQRPSVTGPLAGFLEKFNRGRDIARGLRIGDRGPRHVAIQEGRGDRVAGRQRQQRPPPARPPPGGSGPCGAAVDPIPMRRAGRSAAAGAARARRLSHRQWYRLQTRPPATTPAGVASRSGRRIHCRRPAAPKTAAQGSSSRASAG